MRRPGAPAPHQRFYKMDPTDQRPWSFYKSPKFMLWFLGPTFVFCLFAYGIYAISYLLCTQTLADRPGLAAFFIIFFNGPMLIATISLLRTTFSDPGSVPPNFEDDVILRERNPEGQIRFCKSCGRNKPDRAHHCSTVGHCVLKMDHFCPWVGNCVGFRNYKFFMLFVLWTTVTCALGSIFTAPFAFSFMGKSNIGAAEINQIVVVFVAGIFALVLMGFSGQHLWLVFNNLTTIESFDRARVKARDPPFGIEVFYSLYPWSKYSKQIHVANNVYDLGKRRNWEQVFGSNPYLWVVPIRNPVGDGLEWNINLEEAPLVMGDHVV